MKIRSAFRIQPVLRLFLASTALALVMPLAGAEILMFEPRGETTARDHVNVAGRVSPGDGTTVTVGGVDVPVLRTGIFMRENVPLSPGPNAITAELKNAARATVTSTVLQITRTESARRGPAALPPTPLKIDTESIKPAQDVAVAGGDDLRVSFRGSPGASASFEIPGLGIFPMQEAASDDPNSTAPKGVYEGMFAVSHLLPSVDAPTSPVIVRLTASSTDVTTSAAASIEQKAGGRIAIWASSGTPRMLRVTGDRGILRYGLTEVRLNGPNLAEVPRETLLRAIGRLGRDYKVRLAPGLEAWVSERDVEEAPRGTPAPHLEFTGLSVSTEANGDVINIPYSVPIPFAVNGDSGSGPGTLPVVNIDLYGAHNAVTWITHRNPGGLIHRVTPEQPGTDHLRLRAELTTGPLWGYKAEVLTSTLKITIRRPPQIAPAPASPLAGLTIAVNAGHGGRESGARGLSRVNEKDINLGVAQALAAEFTAAGARAVLTRTSDEVVAISRRSEIAMQANADLFVSIHANATGDIATSGTSTFYKWPHNHDLAECVRQAIVARTHLASFGTVGNFNYSPIRALTFMPAILVEQGFLSNPYDDAQLTDPVFQKEMARAVREGFEKFVSGLRATR